MYPAALIRSAEEMQPTYKACERRNTGEAYRRFRSPTALSGVHERVVAAIGHKVTGGVIALMCVLGVIGWWMNFWPGP